MKPSTEQDYRLRIARVIEAILVDPGAAHTVDSLAAKACLSPFHFHRIYRAMTGESLAETLRRVRLAQAARQLAGMSASVTEIALDIGYGSSQSFARAFRDAAGITPSEFQTRQRQLAEAPPPDAAPLADLVLVEIPPLFALCLRHQGPLATIPHSFATLFRRLDGEAGGQAIGIAIGDPEDPEGFSYDAGWLVEGPAVPPLGLRALSLAGGLYASYRLVGPYELIAPTFQTLFGCWLPQSGYEPDDRPTLEIYRDMSPRTAPERSVTDLLIPIRRP